MPRIPLASMDKILRQDNMLRVAESAKEALLEAVEEETRIIAQKSSQMARHSKRKTVLKDDVDFVLRNMKQ